MVTARKVNVLLRKILLAEDSALLRAGTLAELLRAAGHEVVEAVDADSLVAACQATSPDLVVSDVRMPPKMSDDGLEAVYRLGAKYAPTRMTRTCLQ